MASADPKTSSSAGCWYAQKSSSDTPSTSRMSRLGGTNAHGRIAGNSLAELYSDVHRLALRADPVDHAVLVRDLSRDRLCCQRHLHGQAVGKLARQAQQRTGACEQAHTHFGDA